MIDSHTLDNGLRILVRRTTAAPVAAVYLWLDAGGIDEAPGEEGAAHFLEHMLFKGTGRRGIGAAAAEIEGLGGDLNAFTAHDETVLHATVEASAAATAIDVIADMVRESHLHPEEHEREKQVILEEIRGYEDDPDTVLEETTLARLFPGHPYGRPILGTVESVSGLSAESLRRFHERHHGPDRAILSVAGDVDPDAIVAAARKCFASWVPLGRPRRIPEVPSPPDRPITERVARAFDTAAVEIAWRAMAVGHRDAAALDVLATALGEGAASRLTARLQLEEHLASEAWSTLSLRRGGGTLSFGFLPQEGKTADAVAAALEEIQTVARRGLPGAVIARARDAIVADFLFASETVDNLAHDAAWYLSLLGNPDEREHYRDAVAAVGPDDVRRVAKTWLAPERCAVVALDRELEPKRLTRAVRRGSTVPGPEPGPKKPVKHVWDNGATLWVLPDDGPVVAAHAVVLGGGLADTGRYAGATTAWSRMVTSGAGDLDATAFAEAIDDVAGTVEGVAGRSAMSLQATFPAAWSREGLGLVGAALVDPWFDDKDWERVRDEMLEDVRTQDDRPEELADDLLWEALYRGHPWRLPPMGTPSTIRAITPKRLRRLHEDLVTADNLVVAVAGGIDPEDAKAWLGDWMRELPRGPYLLPGRPVVGPTLPGTRQVRAGREQAHVSLASRGPASTDPDRLALRVAAAVLDGQGGRLFLSLREQKGLAYSVWSELIASWDGGVFGAGLSTDPARVDDARRALRAELEALVARPPDEDEVRRYVRMLSGGVAMGLQRASGRAADCATGERFGTPWGLDRQRAALNAVDAAAVSRAVRRFLSGGIVEIVVTPEGK